MAEYADIIYKGYTIAYNPNLWGAGKGGYAVEGIPYAWHVRPAVLKLHIDEQIAREEAAPAPSAWEVKYTDPQGAEQTKIFGTEPEAQVFAATVPTEIERWRVDYIDSEGISQSKLFDTEAEGQAFIGALPPLPPYYERAPGETQAEFEERYKEMLSAGLVEPWRVAAEVVEEPKWSVGAEIFPSQAEAIAYALKVNTAEARGISLSDFERMSPEHQTALIAQTGAGAAGVELVVPEGAVVTYNIEHEGKLYKFGTEEEAEVLTGEIRTASALNIPLEEFLTYPEGKRDVLVAQTLAPMKFTVSYTSETGEKLAKDFDTKSEATAFAEQTAADMAKAELEKRQDEVRRQKQSLIAGVIGISSVMTAGGLWGILGEERTADDIVRAGKMVVSGAVEALPTITFTSALGVGALAVGGPLAAGAVFLGSGLVGLSGLYKAFGTKEAQDKFNEWAQNNPQEAYDLLLKSQGALALGTLVSLGTSYAVGKIQQYELDKFYTDLPLDDWEAWYVKEEVMAFYPEEATMIQPISDQIMARHRELSMGPTNWVEKWYKLATAKGREVLSGEVVIAEGTGDLPYGAVIADNTLMPTDARTGKIIYRPDDMTLLLAHIAHNPAFRVQLEGLAARGVYIPGWMGIAGVRVLTDVEYQSLLSKAIDIVISDDGKLAYYTIIDIDPQQLGIATLPDLTRAQLTKIEQLLADPEIQKLITKVEFEPTIDSIHVVDEEYDIIQEVGQIPIVEPIIEPEPVPPVPVPIPPVPPVPVPTPPPELPPPERPPPRVAVPKPPKVPKVKIPRVKIPEKMEMYRVSFTYTVGSETEKVDAKTFKEAYTIANGRRKSKLHPTEVRIHRLGVI